MAVHQQSGGAETQRQRIESKICLQTFLPGLPGEAEKCRQNGDEASFEHLSPLRCNIYLNDNELLVQDQRESELCPTFFKSSMTEKTEFCLAAKSRIL